MKRIYLPVPTPETIEMANIWNAGRAAKGKHEYPVIRCYGQSSNKIVRRKLRFGALRAVRSSDNLIIIMHGGKTDVEDHGQPAHVLVVSRKPDAIEETTWGGAVTKYVGGTPKIHSEQTLAAHLDAEGLCHDISAVTLFACSAGATRPSAGIDRSFAARFKDEMLALDFHQALRVFAYGGDLKPNYGHRYRADDDPDEEHESPGMHHRTKNLHKGVYDERIDDWVRAKKLRIEV